MSKRCQIGVIKEQERHQKGVRKQPEQCQKGNRKVSEKYEKVYFDIEIFHVILFQ